MKPAILCLTPSPGDMLRYDADRGAIVDPCEDDHPIVAVWRDGSWMDPFGHAGFSFEPCDVALFNEIRANAKKWPKRCGCGRSYTEHEWALITIAGTMVDEVESLELRNCVSCKSTIAQVIE